jgi:predicted phage terminase large subunit-like protein
LGGGLVKVGWFRRYRNNDRPERFEHIVQSWDTANKATELSDFSVCTTWGVKGKDLYLLAVFRQRLEYPALKRAVREHQSEFGANVVLIEDKASGTQLIQELIAEGCYTVTRYEPTLDKIMRLHAQTAMIENGFVHIPENAPWLAEYLHELAIFPKGKYDDQADSTAQFLDWWKKRSSNDWYYEWARTEAERLTNPEKDRERHRVLLEGPLGMSVQTRSGRHLNVAWDGTIELSADDAEVFIRDGWPKLGEGIIDPDLYDGDQMAETDKLEAPKTVYAKGSVEWEKQQQEEKLARIASEEAKEKRRLARVAALRGKTL